MNWVNQGILLSSKKIFKDNKKIEDFIKNKINNNHIVLYSILTFHADENKKIQDWAYRQIKEIKEETRQYHILSRHQKLITLKYLLINYKKKKLKLNFNNDLRFLYKLLAKVNDIDVYIGTNNHSIINAFFFSHYDNDLSQLKRSQEIFLKHEKMQIYNIKFEKYYGISLKNYLFIVYYLNVHYKLFSRLNYTNPYNLDEWYFNLDKNPIAKRKRSLFQKVFNIISFDIQEGQKYSRETLIDYYNFDLFRNKPFLKLDNNTYTPIDGTFSSNLIFNNLFYKVFDILDEKNRKNFMGDFGTPFEDYVAMLTKFACDNTKQFDYIYIPKFVFKYKRNKLKSPDAMIYDSKDNYLLVIEVKSARVLNSISTSKNDDTDIHTSYDKIKGKPFKQVYESMTKIAEVVKANNLNIINDEETYKKVKNILKKEPTMMFLTVTMNDIPMSMIKHSIVVSSKKILEKDITKAFFSMNIEAFETFIKIISSNFEYDFSQVLGGYNNNEDNMSIKTYFSRMIKHNKIENEIFSKMFLNSQDEYQDFIWKHE